VDTQKEEMSELVKVQRSRLSPLSALGHLEVRLPLNAAGQGCFLLNWVTKKPREWGMPEVQKVLWVM